MSSSRFHTQLPRTDGRTRSTRGAREARSKPRGCHTLAATCARGLPRRSATREQAAGYIRIYTAFRAAAQRHSKGVQARSRRPAAQHEHTYASRCRVRTAYTYTYDQASLGRRDAGAASREEEDAVHGAGAQDADPGPAQVRKGKYTRAYCTYAILVHVYVSRLYMYTARRRLVFPVFMNHRVFFVRLPSKSDRPSLPSDEIILHASAPLISILFIYFYIKPEKRFEFIIFELLSESFPTSHVAL